MKKYLLLVVVQAFTAYLHAQDPAYPAAPAAPQNITAAESFIDTDPGIGSGTVISITAAINISNAAPVINIAGLSNGVHRVYIRTRNNEGRWSITATRDFLYDASPVYKSAPATPQNMVAAEYFIDNDPGFGAATPISFSPSVNISNQVVAINTAGLANGTHRLFIRTRSNEGRWSMAEVKDFNVDFNFTYPAAPSAAQNIVATEYFIDTDPGFENATPISIAAAVNVNNAAAAINTSGLSTGSHRLYIRSKSQEGRWSITAMQDFLVSNDFSYPAAPASPQNITAAEYFIDSDPGTGLANAIAITPSVTVGNIVASVNTSGLSSGSHVLQLRTRNAEGVWSVTNQATFFTNQLAVTPDSLSYGNVPVSSTVVKNLVITNNSASTQTISSLTVPAAFSANKTAPFSIAAGTSDTLQVSFTPAAATAYSDSIRMQTSAGYFAISIKGIGTSQTASWTIEPATGYDFGNTAVNNSSNSSFTIRNTGNTSITLGNVSGSNASFVPTFTAGTVILAGQTISIPVVFTPATVGAFTGQLSVASSATGLPVLTTTVTGSGYTPGTAPVIQYVAAAPFSGVSGVNPAAGQPGLFTYKILYKSANNRAPQSGYPRTGIDLNGDGDFDDLGEGQFAMQKEGGSTDYTTGVVYSYTFNHANLTSTAGYQFFAVDDNGNAASTLNTAYKAGPLVTNQQLDLRIFANDISFSKTNPQPGETFTVTATVSNSTAIPASNVPVKFYRDTILVGSAVIPAVNAFSSATISRTLNFAAEGFFPIKVWIDSSNTLGESNILNNYAIRPVVVGSPNLPGGITTTTNVSIQYCPQLAALITGNAVYFGTGSATAVAGAQVTINTGTQLVTTTTDANGNFSYLLTGVSCGGNFNYTVSITDFTFTSSLVSNGAAVPCITNPCAVPRPQGGVNVSVLTSGCSNTVGSSANINFVIKYRSRDVSNMWGTYDEIIHDTLKVFKNGVLDQTIVSADYSHFPGDDRIIPVSVPLTSTAPVTITGELSYTYIEYLQIPDNFYHGVRTKIVANGGGSIQPEANLPDLTIQQFSQPAFTQFNFVDANVKCGPAGAHTVLVFDSMPGIPRVLKQTTNVAGLNGGLGRNISFSDPTLVPGTHFLIIITDAGAAVTEQDETNNQFIATVIVPAPDLSITSVKASPTALGTGSVTRFTAMVKNTGKAVDSFYVRFTANNTQVGALVKVNSLNENDSVRVTSDAHTVTSAVNACGDMIAAFADYSSMITESNENNNSRQVALSADLSPYQLASEVGAAGNPVVVRVNTSNQFFPAVRNVGEKDAANVTVKFTLNGNPIGNDTISTVKAGEMFAAHASFTRMFSTPGDYVVRVTTDTANTVCESNESNNAGDFHIRVVDSKPDFEVLSQYISPSSLNPNAGQNITIVGTVRNSGGKPTTPNVLRFMVDGIPLGSDVPLNSLQPGADTTVAATASFSSTIAGVKVMSLVADPMNTLDEEIESNNEATRMLIIGDAPDMARSKTNAIRFNPGGFTAGDSVVVSYSIKNNGVQAGTAWARFLIYNDVNALTAIDSVQFTLAAGSTMEVSRKMKFDTDKGTVITQIVNCSPLEFDLLNNNDTLAYSTVMMLKASATLSNDLDMKAALPDMLPGWIGGKLVLGDYDLTVNGIVINFDSAHYIVTNGTGRLKLVNNNAENVFPVSASLNSSSFVKINNSGVPDNFTVRVAPYVLQQGNTGDTLRAAYVNRTWFIDEQTAGGSNAAVSFYWDALQEQPGFDRSLSRSAHYTGSWQLGDAGNAVTEAAGRFSKTQAGYNSFSPFTVTSVNAALPLHLLQFTVAAKEHSALLKWQTTDEINTSGFVIQHSVNGLGFEDAGTVTSRNTAGINNYTFTHGPLVEGPHYYRLKMTDRDGRFTYSEVKLLRIGLSMSVLQVYPNPARQFITVTGIAAKGVLQVLSADGRLLMQFVTNGSSMQVNLGKLAGGLYIISYRDNDGLQQQKIIKE